MAIIRARGIVDPREAPRDGTGGAPGAASADGPLRRALDAVQTAPGNASLRLVASLPYDAQLALGRALGRALHRVGGERRRVATANVARAFPELDAGTRAAIVRESFVHAGMGTAEAMHAWYGRPRANAARFAFDGTEHVDGALAAGRGVILLQAHFSALDVAARAIGARWPLTIVTGYPRTTARGREARRRRERTLERVIDNGDARAIVRSLERGELVWYSPDVRVPRERGGLPVRYFGQCALTSDATARFAALTGAAVVPYVALREDGGARYTLRFDAPLALDADPALATRQINALFETEVRERPEQYLWLNRRFEPSRARRWR